MRLKPTYANVTATVALILATSGTAIAAKHYLITSTSQISPHVLSQLRGHNGSQGPGGPGGPQGPGGPAGAQGPAGPVNLGGIVRVAGPLRSAGQGQLAQSVANCPFGYDVISGGYSSDGTGAHIFINDWNTTTSWVAFQSTGARKSHT